MLFCVKGIGCDDKHNNLNKPFRILETDSHSVISLLHPKCHGHKTIEDLRKECAIWRRYFGKDPDSARKICEQRFILQVKDFVLMPICNGYDELSCKILKHTVFGELKKDIQGIHFNSKLNPAIKNINTKQGKDKKGVWVADIEYYSKTRRKLYIKKDSTMFPESWTPTILMSKIYIAYLRKLQCKSNPDVFHSITDCGIKVDFIIKKGEIKTVYPIYEE